MTSESRTEVRRGDDQRETRGLAAASGAPGVGATERILPPTVSVVITCYNQAHFLGEAVESVLAQSHPGAEVIVVDDGSPKDDPAAVAARYPTVRFIRQSNQGVAAARNTGLRESTGDYIVFVDADDHLLPHALEIGLTSFGSHPECAFVFGRALDMTHDGAPLPPIPSAPVSKSSYAALLSRNHIHMPAMVMYRRGAVEAVGGFDPAADHACDYDLYLRIARQYPIHDHDKAVAEYRKHDSNMSHDFGLMVKNTTAVLRRQRKYVGRDGALREAYQKGVRNVQEYYGERIVARVRRRVSERRGWGETARDLRLLLRFAPRILARHALRKVYCLFSKGTNQPSAAS